MSRAFMFLALVLLPLSASAQIYKCKDKAGNVVYSIGIPQGCAAPSAGSRAGSSAPSPADFPRVSSELQKERDMTRRGILQRELEAERILLASVGSDKSYIHERNIQAINRELQLMR